MPHANHHRHAVSARTPKSRPRSAAMHAPPHRRRSIRQHLRSAVPLLRVPRSLLLWLCALLLLASVPACTTVTDVETFRDRAAEARSAIAAEADRLESLLARLPETAPERPHAEAALAEAAARVAALDAALLRLEQVLAEAREPTDGLTRAAELLSGILPEPFAAPVLLGGALAATLLRARQLKSGAASIARSIEIATAADPALAERFRAHASTLRATQTATARRIVDEIQRPATTLALPI